MTFQKSCFAGLTMGLLLATAGCQRNQPGQGSAALGTEAQNCDPNSGLALPPGFCATIFADNIGHARHLAVGVDGTLFANTWSGEYFNNDKPPAGGFLIAMRDTNGDGKADEVRRLGETSESGATGGTGVAVYGGAVFVEQGSRILRYAIGQDGLPTGKPDVVLDGLATDGEHNMHPFVIGANGDLFVNTGSATNTCQVKNRMPESLGLSPCPEKQLRAGIWRYDANARNQHYSASARYASGLRNTGGLTFDGSGRLYGTQHGRDELAQNWRRFYTAQQGAELPAEELVEIAQGKDYGWPECYFDPQKGQLMLAPEYGGDGTKTGICAERQGPVAAFPAHWAPNDVAYYGGASFPAAYKGGMFIAFHGSWNRAPLPQAGYNVVFQPFANGRPSGQYIVFADGFAGGERSPEKAMYRPAGLAVGRDGALYVADDQKGRIWRITYRGPADASLVAASQAANAPAAPADGEKSAAAAALPPGATAEQFALGEAVFTGRAAGGTCAGCHGASGGGTSMGPSLTNGKWIWSDGSLEAIEATIRKGVAKPRNNRGAMPPMGGSNLSERELDAVSVYVWSLGHTPAKPAQ
jgi:glucose/arabinose dehydrogenase